MTSWRCCRKKARELNQRLTEILTRMNATYPSFNPHYAGELPHKDKVPVVVGQKQRGRKVEVTYREQGARVVSASLIYTTNGDHPRAEWFRKPGKLLPGLKVALTLPPRSTHYFINLVDENNFLVCHPDLPETSGKPKTRTQPTATALTVE